MARRAGKGRRGRARAAGRLGDVRAFQIVLRGSQGRSPEKPSRRREELPLRGFLECQRCGRNLTGSATKGNGGTYFYYHCQQGKGCTERFRADKANEQLVERLRSIAVAPEVARLHLAVMEDIFCEKEGSREQQIANVDAEIKKLEKRLFDVDEKFVEGALQPDSYHRLKSTYLEKKGELERRKAELEHADTNFMKYVRYGLSLLSDLPRYYREAPVAVKQKMVGLIFPGKLVFEGEKYRTTEMNEAIGLLRGKKADFAAKKEGPTASDRDQSCLVPPAGFQYMSFMCLIEG